MVTTSRQVGPTLEPKNTSDQQGFPMKQGVLVNHRVRLLLSDGHSCYRARRDGERKRKVRFGANWASKGLG